MVFGSHIKPKEGGGTQTFPGLKTTVQSHLRDRPGARKQGVRQESVLVTISQDTTGEAPADPLEPISLWLYQYHSGESKYLNS